MKRRIFRFGIPICLVLLIGLWLFGAKAERYDPSATLPSWSPEQMETVQVDESNDYMYGTVIGKMSPNVLVLGLGTIQQTKLWGDTAYVITDEVNEWCIGDLIGVSFFRAERPLDTDQHIRVFADGIWERYPPGVDKPILYFYPETPTVCSAKVTLKGELTCTYPSHGVDGWQNFTAHPDGTLVFPDGKEYYALYWEGVQDARWDFSQGWCVRGEDTAAFLEWALAQQGLTRREANEFIIYWLPLMQNNPYNVISFQTEAYTDGAVLDITPAPDSLLRVFMAYYPTEVAVDIQPQTFDGFERQGFTVVEWGGSRVSEP